MPTLFEDVADRLGLTAGTAPGLLAVPFIKGQIDGQKVRCTWGDRGTRVEAPIAPALDLGLHVHSRSFANRPSFAPRVVLGDSNWDDEVIATADEPARASVLLTPEVRGAILRLNATTTDVEVHDDRVFTFVLIPDTSALADALTQAARVAASVAAARRAVPVAAPLAAHAAVLQPFAREHQLERAGTPLLVRGELRGVHLEAHYSRAGAHRFDLDLRTRPLDAPPSFGLVVRRESAVDRVRTFFGAQDLRTGDPAFDPAYLVRADDPDRAATALDPDVRALLLDLRARFEEITLENASLIAKTPAAKIRPEDLIMLLEAACTISERVARAATAISHGPYR